jgi:hypothetical protein
VTGAPEEKDESEKETKEQNGSRRLEYIIAQAILESLENKKSGGRHGASNYVLGEARPHVLTTIDGKFYLMAIARHVICTIVASGGGSEWKDIFGAGSGSPKNGSKAE